MASQQSNNMWPEELIHKNRLQNYALKTGLPLPQYHTINGGFTHAPRFKTAVLINKETYTSKSEHDTKRSSEQEAAKIAFESITAKSKQKGCSPIYKNPIYCKSILHEYAVKMNFKPVYKTTSLSPGRPIYVSSCVFNGKTFTGETGQSKKEAEQLVARTVIESLLGSDSGTLVQIIESKKRLFLSLPRNKPNVGESALTVAAQPEIPQPGPPHQARTVQRDIIAYNADGPSGASNWGKRKAEPNIWEQKMDRKKNWGMSFKKE